MTQVMGSPAEVINIADVLKLNEERIYPSYYNDKELKNGNEILKEMGDILCQQYDIDLISRKEWEEMVIKSLQLFNNYMPPKTEPWPNASNVSLPFIVVAALQFHARAYDAIIPAKNVVSCIPVGGDEDRQRAERNTKYMNYQLLYDMDTFEEDMDNGLLALSLVGSMFKKTYFDTVTKKPISQYISALDVVINYGAVSIDDSRVTHQIWLYQNQVRERVASGSFIKEAWNFGRGASIKPSYKKSIDDIQGIQDPQNQLDDNQRLFIEVQTWWDLDGDGIKEPFIITVDYDTKTVVKITDRRYIDAFGRIQTINYYTHYKLFPNSDGFYGLGFGILLGGLNKAANDIVNEVIDAGDLANTQGGFVTQLGGAKRGVLEFKRGEFKEINVYIDDLKKAIWTFDFKGPNQTLYAVLGLLYEYAKLVSGLSETMTGQLPASDTPATTVLALIEEGRKLFSSIHKRIHRTFKKELKKIYRLNSIFINPIIYFKVLGDNNTPQGDLLQISRSDFVDTIDVIPVSDPTIISKAEKVIKAKELRDDVLANPLTSGNQQSVYLATRAYYEAIDAPYIDDILQPPPPPPNLNPYDENALFIQEKTSIVYPDQDHQHHMLEHNILLDNTNTFGASITNEGKRLVEIHQREHLAMLYRLQAEQELQTLQGEQNGNNQRGMEGMVAA